MWYENHENGLGDQGNQGYGLNHSDSVNTKW